MTPSSVARAAAARVLLLALFVRAADSSAAVTGDVHTVVAGESLTRIAEQAYGAGRAWTAILLATNSRLATMSELNFIGDPNALVPGQRVWVPDVAEKDRWLRLYRAYVAAILDMSLPQPWEVSSRLVSIPEDAPARVLTWARDGQFALGETVAGREIWVTAVPHLRRFCQALSNRSDLVVRLEQRLGLPPASNKSVFVEIQVARPADDLFRPCADPRIDTSTCSLGPPESDAPFDHRNWFLTQYFSSYAQAHPTRYPWTSLGYTYDWGDPSSEEGESEFVIKPAATINVLSITTTEDYCRP